MAKFSRKFRFSTPKHLGEKIGLFTQKHLGDLNGITLLKDFILKRNAILCRSFDDYISHQKPKTSKVVLSVFNIFLSALVTTRFLIVAVLNNKWSWNFFAEGHYLVGKPDMLCYVYAIFTINCLLAQIVNLWFDLKDQFFLIELIDQIDNNRDGLYYLNPRLRSKFAFRVTLLCKLFFKVVYYQMFFGSCAIHYLASILAFMDPSMDIQLISLLFWLIVLTLFWNNIFSLAMSSVAIAYASITYVKFQFRDIHQSIKVYSSMKHNSNGRPKEERFFPNILESHQFWLKNLNQIDVYFSKILGIVYFGFSFPLALGLSVIVDQSQSPVTRMIFIVLEVNTLFVMAVITLISASVHMENDKIHNNLYKIFANKQKISFLIKYKIMSFIEKLTQSFIGITCFGLFGFTDFVFFEYLMSTSGTFFMTSEMFNVNI